MGALEQLLALRSRRLYMRRADRLARAPALPRAAEAAYVAELRRFVGRLGKFTEEHVLPRLLENARKDDQQPAFNEFALLDQEAERQSQDAMIIPFVSKQADDVAKFTTRAVGKSIGIGFGLADTAILGPSIASFVTQNTGLIRTLSQGYVARVGQIVTGMQGARASEISDALQDAVEVTKSHADLIAVDQTLKLYSQVTEVRQTQVGVQEYVWTTAHDERVRPGHRLLDGTRHSWNQQPPVVDLKTGRRDHPGRDFRCRCQAIAIVPGFN